MSTESVEQSPLIKKAIAYADKWLAWKTKPRLGNTPPPNPADFDLTPEQGQIVIENCIRVMEQAAVERAQGITHRP